MANTGKPFGKNFTYVALGGLITLVLVGLHDLADVNVAPAALGVFLSGLASNQIYEALTGAGNLSQRRKNWVITLMATYAVAFGFIIWRVDVVFDFVVLYCITGGGVLFSQGVIRLMKQ
ncbi:MAG TPA: hypothetical protein VIL71_04260 [Spirillospora sp.]